MSFVTEIDQWTDSTIAKGSEMNVPLQKLLENTLQLREDLDSFLGESFTVKASTADSTPRTLSDKIELGAGLGCSVVQRTGSSDPTDLVLRIHREDELSIMTPAVVFPKILSDVEVNASNISVGQWLDCRFAPINFPSGFIYSISFMLALGTQVDALNVAVYGSDNDSLADSTRWLGLRNCTLIGNELFLPTPLEIIRYKFNWVCFSARGGARFIGKLPSSIVPASGESASVGVISNWIQDGSSDWPNSLAGTTHNSGAFPYIQFNITR